MNDKHHEMILEKTHASGVEEWYCPDCGRRFLVQWPPAYKMIVLAQGDKDIRHNVSKAKSVIDSYPITRTKDADLSEDFRLIPWMQWMEKVNFANRWETNA